jgi:hypothetical protein
MASKNRKDEFSSPESTIEKNICDIKRIMKLGEIRRDLMFVGGLCSCLIYFLLLNSFLEFEFVKRSGQLFMFIVAFGGLLLTIVVSSNLISYIFNKVTGYDSI